MSDVRILPDPPPGFADIRTDDKTAIDPIKRDAWIEQQFAEAASVLDAAESNRAKLSAARALLLEYGTPDGLSFAETHAAAEAAALDYRDSGVRDTECEEHLQWITARIGQITVAETDLLRAEIAKLQDAVIAVAKATPETANLKEVTDIEAAKAAELIRVTPPVKEDVI